MVRFEAKSNIQGLLEKNSHGMSQKKISEILNISRPTVKKYLEELEYEGQVTTKEVGSYNVWVLNNSNGTSQDENLVFSIELISALINSIVETTTEKVDWKEVGKKLNRNFEYVRSLMDLGFLKKYGCSKMLKGGLQTLVSFFEDYLNLVNFNIDEVEMKAPIIFEKDNFFIFRIVNSSFIKNPRLFYILIGLMEAQAIEQFHNVKLEIDCIADQVRKFVDIKIQVIEWLY